MGLSFPSLPSLSDVRNAVTHTVSSASDGLRDFGTSAVQRTADLGKAGLDLGRRAVDAVRSVDVREAASVVRAKIHEGTEAAREGIKDGVMWAGEHTHQAADFARDHVTGDDIASRGLRSAITFGETQTRLELGVVGGVAREVVGLGDTVGQLGTTAVEMQLSPEARMEYGQKIVSGVQDAAAATGRYAESVVNDPSRLVQDAGGAIDAGKQFVGGQLDRYGQAIREGHGPETIGMDVGKVATYVVPVGGGPVRGAVTAAVRETGEVVARGTAEAVARGTSETVARGTTEGVTRGVGETAARGTSESVVAGGRAAEATAAAGRTVEQMGAELRDVARTEMQTWRAEGLSNNKLGPAVSVAMDRRTGEISSVFRNSREGSLPGPLNPTLADRLGAAGKVDYVKTAGAGSHSEIYAANDLLQKGSRLEDLVVYTEGTKGPLAGTVKPPCPHCAVLLDGVTYAK